MVKLPRIRIPPLSGWPKLPLLSSVRGRIIVGFGLLVLILVVVVGASAWLYREHQSAMAAMEEHAATASLLQDAQVNTNVSALLLQRYVVSGDDTLLPEIRLSAAAAVDSLAEARAQEEMAGDDEHLARIDTMSAAAASLPNTVEQAIALRQSGDIQGAAAAVDETASTFREFRLALGEVAAQERLDVSALRSRADRTADLAFWLLVISGVIGVGLGLAASVLAARSILKPLSSLESAALAVAGGDLEARAPATGPRELARLGASLNRMTDSLLDASKRRELEEERERAYARLRDSEERLQDFLDNATDLIQSVAPDGSFVYVNRAWRETLGYSEEEVRSLNLFDIIHPDSKTHCVEMFQRVMAGESLDHVEAMFVTKDGRNIWVEGNANCRFEHGMPVATRGIFHDVTARKQAEEALRRANQQLAKDRQEIEVLNRSLEARVKERTQELRESEQLYRSLVETSPDAITLTDLDGKVLVCNEQAARLHGFKSMKGLAGRNAFDFVAPEDRQRAADNTRKTLETGSVKNVEYTLLKADGTRFPAEMSASLIVDAEGNPKALIGVVREISERKRAEGELRLANEELQERNRDLLDARAQAATDCLTGLWNHRAFHERVREEARRAQDNSSPLSLIMMDIDGFKRINDSLGHQAGDDILRALAHTLTNVAPQQDTFRYGGDEFALLLPGADSRKTTRVAERLRRAVERRISNNGESVTVSLGIASFPDTAASADELVYGADAAMYWAKSAGKNRVGDWGKLLGQRAGGALPWYAADRGVKAPEVVAALAAALAAKDPTTAGHTERCSWYALKLAEELGLPDDETSVVRLASLLHDIGKLAIPDEVLLKPGQLNEEEWAQMKQHPTAALHVLSHIRSLTDATPAILHHHEHFDGSGYPDGLAGKDIPIASRILLVTDAFDAMTTDRPYRKAMPIEAAIEELKRNKGSQFDPAVVDAFLSLLAREGAQPLRRMAATQAPPVAAGAAVTSGSGRRKR